MTKLDKIPGNFGVRQHQTSLKQKIILQMEMLRTRCWGPLRTQEPHLVWCPACSGLGCGSLRRPSDASSPGLCEEDEYTQHSAQKPKQFSFCVKSKLNTISEETTENCLWNGVWCSYYLILINLWFSAEIYLLKTSQICLTIRNTVTRNNNKINPKFTLQTKKTDEGSIPQEVTVTIRKNSAVLELQKPSVQETFLSHSGAHVLQARKLFPVRSDVSRNHTGGSDLEPRFHNVQFTAPSTKLPCLQYLFEN